MDPISLRRRERRLPAVLVCLGLLLLGLLFVPECDDCYFVYWRFDSLADWLLTRPSPPAGVSEDVIVGVPENGRYLGNLLGVLQGKLYFVPWAGPLLRGALMGGALCALVFLLSRWTRRGPVGSGEALALAFALVLLAPRGEAIGRRVAKIRETGAPQHANWGAMDWCAEQGILKYAMDPDGTVSSLPSDFFAPAKGYTRRQVYEAYRI